MKPHEKMNPPHTADGKRTERPETGEAGPYAPYAKGAAVGATIKIRDTFTDGYWCADHICLEKGHSLEELPFGDGRAVLGDPVFFSEMCRALKAGSVTVWIFRFVTKARTWVIAKWDTGKDLAAIGVPRYFTDEHDGQYVNTSWQEEGGYWGKLLDKNQNELCEVVYNIRANTPEEDELWLSECCRNRAHMSDGGQTKKPVGTRGKRLPVSISQAALICAVSERQIKYWNAGRSTPEDWPGCGNMMRLLQWQAQRKREKKVAAMIKNAARYGDMDQVSKQRLGRFQQSERDGHKTFEMSTDSYDRDTVNE